MSPYCDKYGKSNCSSPFKNDLVNCDEVGRIVDSKVEEEDWLAREHLLADEIKNSTPTHQSPSHDNINCHTASPSIDPIFTREAELCDMCGIYASISPQRLQQPSNLLKELLHNRGPDHTGEHFSRVDGKYDTSYWISLFSTVLA